jgi:hypothetical protein
MIVVDAWRMYQLADPNRVQNGLSLTEFALEVSTELTRDEFGARRRYQAHGAAADKKTDDEEPNADEKEEDNFLNVALV